VEEGEAPWDAAVRETREEVGLSVVVNRLIEVSWKPKDGELVFTFECFAVAGELGLSDETEDVAYFDPDSLPANLSPVKRERILAFVADPDRVMLRTRTTPSVRELIARGEL
jgi:ADP-ribose pyrophosphatase YjhB (NUDIX family)